MEFSECQALMQGLQGDNAPIKTFPVARKFSMPITMEEIKLAVSMQIKFKNFTLDFSEIEGSDEKERQFFLQKIALVQVMCF